MKVSKTSIGKTNGKTYFYVLSLFFSLAEGKGLKIAYPEQSCSFTKKTKLMQKKGMGNGTVPEGAFSWLPATCRRRPAVSQAKTCARGLKQRADKG
jgi:hypothetical protein